MNEQQPQQEQKPKNKKSKMYTWGGIILVILALIIIGAIAGSGDDDNNSNTTSNTTTPTNTQASTDTVAGEDEYKNSMATITNDVSESLFYIADFSENNLTPGLWDEDEIYDLELYTATIEFAYDDAGILDVPEKYEEFHAVFLQALEKYAEAMPLLRDGIDELDVDMIEEAAEIIEEGNVLLDQSAIMLEQII